MLVRIKSKLITMIYNNSVTGQDQFSFTKVLLEKSVADLI